MIKGIVIYFQEYKEYDALIHILTKEEIVPCIAKGVLKINSKNKGAVQLFSYSEFEFVDDQKTMKVLKHAKLLDSFYSLRNDLNKQTCALYMCECIDKAHICCFDLLYASLKHLQDELYSALCLFQACFNKMIGVLAYVDGCVCCNSESNIIALSIKEGGFVCGSCKKEMIVDDLEFLKLFRIYSKADFIHFPLLKKQYPANKKIWQYLYAFLSDYSGLTIKTANFLNQIL